MAQRFLTLILLLCSTSVLPGCLTRPAVLYSCRPGVCFRFQQNQHDLNLTWQVKEGYYLYRKQVSITPAQANVGALQMPAGEWHEDEFYGKSEIYRQRLSVP
jgi:thiol:disulfide interchange protein DsbD